MNDLINKATALIDSVADDNNRHGGLLSRDTTRRADELRVEINRILTDQALDKAVNKKDPDQCELPLS